MALAEIARVKPERVVFDSLSEIRLLSQGSLRYRRQVLALKSYFLLNDATVLMLDDLTSEQDNLNLHSISHAVLRLEQVVPAYGRNGAGSASQRCAAPPSGVATMILPFRKAVCGSSRASWHPITTPHSPSRRYPATSMNSTPSSEEA